MAMSVKSVRRPGLFLAVTACVLVQGVLAQQVWGAPSTAQKAEKPAKAEAAAKIDLNTATSEQLQTLPGIGEAYAKRLVATRPYASIKDLAKTGIPAATLAKIKPLVTVSESAATTKAAKAATKAAKAEAAAEKPAAKSAEVAGKSVATAAKTAPKKGDVWVNTESKVFHKEGSRWYGNTKQGKWMSEADALKQGYRAAKE